MLNWSDDDDGTCLGCGCNMEVIGPPGPRHAADCPYERKKGQDAADEADLANLSQEKEWLDRLFARSGKSELQQYFDEVLFKHHGADMDFDDEF